MIALLLAGCATPMLLPTHHAAELLESPLAEDQQTGPPSFAGRTVVLSFEGDETSALVGALLDDYHRGITPATQSYVMSRPGLVLFESLAMSVEESGAQVFRAYSEPMVRPDAIAGAPVVGVHVLGLEVHRWRTREGDYLLLGADVRFTVGGASYTDRVMTRVTADRDVFLAAGGELAAALHARLP